MTLTKLKPVHYIAIGAAVLLIAWWLISGSVGKQANADNDVLSHELFNGESPWVAINENMPEFTEEEKQSTASFEIYSELDYLGRAQIAYANIGPDILPDGNREATGNIQPTGWNQNQYDFITGKYLYNRCQLIGTPLSNASNDERNIITATRYMNIDAMLPIEAQIANFVKETGYHVLYRVTPMYFGDNLLAEGVQVEAFSVEDNGASICFNAFCCNVQPGVEINYEDGSNWVAVIEQ